MDNVVQEIMKIVNDYESNCKSNLIIDLLSLIPAELHPTILAKLENGESILED